jgi:hypothetical protein
MSYVLGMERVLAKVPIYLAETQGNKLLFLFVNLVDFIVFYKLPVELTDSRGFPAVSFFVAIVKLKIGLSPSSEELRFDFAGLKVDTKAF